MTQNLIKLGLRLALAFGFLSAVADRFGLWPTKLSTWGNWQAFLDFTQVINPWAPIVLIPLMGWIATIAEVVFATCLLIGFKTELFAKLSGCLLLLFAIAMMASIGIKSVFDYSVLSATAAAFALSLLKQKFLELDSVLTS